ncbi:MAG: hypothetical protein EBT07_16960, partial [Actinobacteria bacterium]|nr:hypothetical protein [Actinomycetota bacterium]
SFNCLSLPHPTKNPLRKTSMKTLRQLEEDILTLLTSNPPQTNPSSFNPGLGPASELFFALKIIWVGLYGRRSQ